ncbi:hypothetical protein SDC9_117537 [bioreactor metagenome]|uniref:Uncharacterized protein n=1 Tax=bioreactor metagenome TaxID=1076179 RepID=A0A645BZ11_9ZZZZ
MIRQAFILFFIAFELLLLFTLHSAINIFLFTVFHIVALNHKKFSLMMYVLRIDRVGVALAKGKVINRIQHIGFSHPVVADEAVDLFRKIQSSFPDIFVI